MPNERELLQLKRNTNGTFGTSKTAHLKGARDPAGSELAPSAESYRTSRPNAYRGGPGRADQQPMPSPDEIVHSLTTAVLMVAAVAIGFGVGIAAMRLVGH